ncbi:MAG: DNA repair protein RecN [Alphaproteobacteria bacterium]|nr:DNA repair protein RecN [Alphaproteobacteria bacterium]
MLRSLSIQNVLLIERLDLEFAGGLCVLTGETGAGKSILIDSLGFVLGARADQRLIRAGSTLASVTAAFDRADKGPTADTLNELGLEPSDELILRRTIGADGRSRNFVNDSPVNVSTLKRIGATLVEIVGQDDADGLLDPSTHRALLDAHGGHAPLLDDVARFYRAWRTAQAEAEAAAEALARARRDEDYFRHTLAELVALDPKPDEEDKLSSTRTRLQHGQKIVDAVAAADAELSGQNGVALRLRAARRHIERVAAQAGGALDPLLETLDRALLEADEVSAAVTAAARSIQPDQAQLDRVEERLFALRAAARKHQVNVAALPEVRARLEATLAALDGDDSKANELAQACEAIRRQFIAKCEQLRAARAKAAKALDAQVSTELKPLKLGTARFETEIEFLQESDAGPFGLERVRFAVATIPGAAPGPLQRIASGGERSRFTLALKLALAAASGVGTVVFDEIDSGVGGAVAAAVGERLARLAKASQVLAVTHSPQVAARGELHLCVRRKDLKGRASTRVDTLERDARREEIARMLSGARITDEARAAADSLIATRPS